MVNELEELVYSLHPLERLVLPFADRGTAQDIVQESELKEEEVMKGLLLLEQRGLVDVARVEELVIELDKFGKKFLNGLPEQVVLEDLGGKAKKQSELSCDQETLAAALGILKREDLVAVTKEDELVLTPLDKGKAFLRSASNPLLLFEKPVLQSALSKEQEEALTHFKQRKGFLKEGKKTVLSFSLTQNGARLLKELTTTYKDLELVDALDSKMLKEGSWKGKTFRHYDTAINVPYSTIARRHPMIEANHILRDVFVEMGFQEMEGPMVETAFWNMDVMWIPQDHPARDDQDTFYLEGQGTVPKELMKKVKQMHEVGLKHSHTQENEWSEETAKRRLLRTHSTATTFRKIAELAERHKKGEDINGKYFYVAHDFRNETIDATHLAEFYQVDGMIIGDDLSLADLMGFIKTFYAKLGIDQIKFKPTFNPYTEPSMEAHYYDPKMKKWYSLINSGTFRPETLAPFGLENKKIIAWGMGASRVATLLAQVDSMRDITGVTCDFEWLQQRPMMGRTIVRK